MPAAVPVMAGHPVRLPMLLSWITLLLAFCTYTPREFDKADRDPKHSRRLPAITIASCVLAVVNRMPSEPLSRINPLVTVTWPMFSVVGLDAGSPTAPVGVPRLLLHWLVVKPSSVTHPLTGARLVVPPITMQLLPAVLTSTFCSCAPATACTP